MLQQKWHIGENYFRCREQNDISYFDSGTSKHKFVLFAIWGSFTSKLSVCVCVCIGRGEDQNWIWSDYRNANKYGRQEGNTVYQ